jgi:AraC family transcriptional regulator, transcriptional activator of pobA
MDQIFNITVFTKEDAVRVSSSPDEPHKHDFEELIVGLEGEMEHFIDYRTTSFSAPFVSFVTKGKVHRVKPGIKNGKCNFWVVSFKSEFIPEISFQLYSYYHDHADLQMKPGECFDRMNVLCGIMFKELNQTYPDYAVLKHLLSALFIMIESERKKLLSDDKGSQKNQNTTFKNFLAILEENFRRPDGVDFYAEKLFMTARNLNLICNNILQKSVSELIETRKLIEAKNLLINSDKTISEIGFELGFNEKSYFTTVFKKKSGQTPSEFREEMKKLIS